MKEELEKRGYRVYVIIDWAREIIRREKEKGDKGILPWTNRVLFEYLVVKHHLNEYRRLIKTPSNYDIVLEDGGGFAAKAYCEVDGVDLPRNYSDLLKRKELVDLVLLMDVPRKYFTDSERWEDRDYALKIHKAIERVHREIFGDKVVKIKYTGDPREKINKALEEVLKVIKKE